MLTLFKKLTLIFSPKSIKKSIFTRQGVVMYGQVDSECWLLSRLWRLGVVRSSGDNGL